MPKTSPKIVFADVEFTGADIKDCVLSEEFSPLSITVPVSSLEFSLHSSDVEFSIINPAGKYATLLSRQPMAVYVLVDDDPKYLGQYYLDSWSSPSENVKQFNCVDILGIIDKYDYLGGLWTTPVTVGSLIDGILSGIGVSYEIDPDIAATQLTGWLPIMSYREALQQVAFAAGAFVTVARRDAIEIGRLSQVAIDNSGIRTGVANAGQSRNWKLRWRETQSLVFTSGGAVTRGIRSGVPNAGQSRLWKRRFRQSQWEGVKPIVDIASGEQSGRKVTLRPEVTGVEVVSHDLVAGTNELTIFNDTLAAGLHEIRFSQPMHTLSITGATIDTAAANYAIVNVATGGQVILKGEIYIDSKKLFSRYLPYQANRKENILRIDDGTLVTAAIADRICQEVFDYHQQRYVQEAKLFSPYTEIGGIVNIETLYGNTLFGVVERMDTDLSRGNVAEVEVVGIIK